MVIALGLSCCSAALTALNPTMATDRAIAVVISIRFLMVSSRCWRTHPHGRAMRRSWQDGQAQPTAQCSSSRAVAFSAWISRSGSRRAGARRVVAADYGESTGLAKSHGVYRLEKLRVRNMTASAAGTVEEPGKNVAQKSGLNRSILDQGWGMFATFLSYKEQERGRPG